MKTLLLVMLCLLALAPVAWAQDPTPEWCRNTANWKNNYAQDWDAPRSAFVGSRDVPPQEAWFPPGCDPTDENIYPVGYTTGYMVQVVKGNCQMKPLWLPVVGQVPSATEYRTYVGEDYHNYYYTWTFSPTETQEGFLVSCAGQPGCNPVPPTGATCSGNQIIYAIFERTSANHWWGKFHFAAEGCGPQPGYCGVHLSDDPLLLALLK